MEGKFTLLYIYICKILACLSHNALCANMSNESCIHFNQQD